MKDYKKLLIIIFIYGLLFIPFLGSVRLFDWDEINFAENAREMIETGNYLQMQIDYAPFWEKPPLFVWFQVLSMKVFGITEFAARFPNAIVGIASMLLLFLIGKKILNEKFGIIWIITYSASFLPFFYFKSGIIDPMFNLFMFLSIYYIYMFYANNYKTYYLIYGGILAGLATLTKGPVGLLLPGISWLFYWLFYKRELKNHLLPVLTYLFFWILTSSVWFGIEFISNGTWFIEEFVKYQIRLLQTGDAGHGGPFYYHFIVILLGCFPASVFLIEGFRKGSENNLNLQLFKKIMIILFWAVLIIFSMVKTKILHYSSLSYYPLTFLSALFIYEVLENRNQLKKYQIVLTGIIGSLISLLFIGLPLVGIFRYELIPYIKDKFAQGNLSSNVDWSYFDLTLGIAFLLILIFSLINLYKKRIQKGLLLLSIAVPFLLFTALPIILPKLELHLQGSAIKFYESIANENALRTVIGFKSYAHLYYSKLPPSLGRGAYGIPNEKWESWESFLMNAELDKPVYFITKNTEAYQWIDNPNLLHLGTHGGYTFFKREPKDKLID